MRIFFVISFFSIAGNVVVAQPLDASFDFPVDPYTVCKNEFLQLDNTSTGASRYFWDFCPETFQESPSIGTPTTISNMVNGWGYKTVFDGTEWFGFLVSKNTNRLFRLEFGSDPTSTPTVSDLGNPGGLFVSPQGLDIVNHQGNWYLFVGKGETTTGQVVRIELGNDLRSAPVASGLGTFGITGRIRDLKVVKQGSDLILLLIMDTGNAIRRVNYRNSFDNSVSAGDITTTSGLIGANLPIGFSVTNVKGRWIVHTVSFSSNAIQQYDFGNNILGPLTFVGSYTFSSVSKPYYIKMIREGNDYFAVVAKEASRLSIINFHDLSGSQAPTEVTNTNFLACIGFDVLKYQGRSVVHGSLWGSSNFNSMIFESNSCNVSESWSEESSPTDIYYTASGTYSVELVAHSSEFDAASDSKVIAVGTSTTSTASILHDNFCAAGSITFEANSAATLSDWEWDMGDGSLLTTENPSHVYGIAGTYNVSVRAIDQNACRIVTSLSLEAFDPPVAEFDLPSASPFCTNQSYDFINQSSFNSQAPITWQWSVNGVDQSQNKDFDFIFTSTSNQDVTLTATIPGCSDQQTKSILTLTEGPITSFTFSGQCQFDDIVFMDNSSGDITGYQWDFGDGQNSTAQNPVHTYLNIGVQDVTLSVTSSSGCNNSYTSPVIIYTRPDVDFYAELPPFSCSGTDTYLRDQTPDPSDSNLSSWNWNFGDPGSSQNTSVLKDPSHIYELAGDYTVELIVTTDKGCLSSLQKLITVSQTPVIDFTSSPACKNVSTQFTDHTQDAVAWTWNINGTNYTNQNPSHIFSTTGPKNVSLHVISGNGCEASSGNQVVVPEPLVPVFTTLKTCANESAEFTDTTVDSTDPIINRKWSFLNQEINTTSPTINHTFVSTGNVMVALEVEANSGCKYLKTSNVTILNKPFSSFTATPIQGGVPLPVQFSNRSTGATTYLWEFGDTSGTTSSASSPLFTYLDQGVFEVRLHASNNQLCSSISSQFITANAPIIDAAITQLDITSTTPGLIRPVVTIVNNGNVWLSEFRLIINIDNETRLSEQILTAIPVSGLYTYEVPFDIIQEDVAFVCAELVLANDFNPENNRNCNNIDGEITIVSPYPNPTDKELFVEWIASEESGATVRMINSLGEGIANWVTGAQEGLNQLKIDTEFLPSGLYILTIETQLGTKSFRVAVEH